VRPKDGTLIAFDRVGEGSQVVPVGGSFSYRRFPKMVEHYFPATRPLS
jgi:hypothetical protein